VTQSINCGIIEISESSSPSVPCVFQAPRRVDASPLELGAKGGCKYHTQAVTFMFGATSDKSVLRNTAARRHRCLLPSHALWLLHCAPPLFGTLVGTRRVTRAVSFSTYSARRLKPDALPVPSQKNSRLQSSRRNPRKGRTKLEITGV
jgi:hypothetical protein